jgi:hypothetical protein
MIDKTNLVYTESEFQDGFMKIPAMQPLRHIAGSDPDHVVFGIGYNAEHFNHYFKFWYDKVMTDWKLLGLLNEDGTVISKTAFGKLLDIHQYGNGRTKKFIGYIHNREIVYQFYPMFTYGNKVDVLNDIYQTYVDTVGGDMDAIDDKNLNFGNCGIPVVYSDVRYKYYDKKATQEFVDQLFGDTE